MRKVSECFIIQSLFRVCKRGATSVSNVYLIILHIFSFPHGVIFRINFRQLVGSSYLNFIGSFRSVLVRSLLQVSSLQPKVRSLSHRLSALPQLTEFSLAVDERTRNNPHAVGAN